MVVLIPAARVYFYPLAKPRRGRPARHARDVAVYLACEWFHSGRAMPGVPAQVRSPITAAVKLWSERGYAGMTEDYKEASAIARRGQRHCAHLDAVVFEDGPAEGARVFLLRNSHIAQVGDELQVLEHEGWCWLYGSEQAQLGRVATRPLSIFPPSLLR